MATTDIGFAMNYQFVNLIDITPTEEAPTWGWLGPGITEIEPDRSDKVSEQDDYSTGGVTVTTVTGVDKSVSVSGTRLIGDPVQEYLASIEDCVGPERETTYRVVTPTGEVVQEKVTIKDPSISGPSGAGSEQQAISFTMTRNDTPEVVTEGGAVHLPESVTASDVEVAVGSTASVQATVQPETASGWCLYAVEDPSIARVTADGVVTGIKAGKTRLAVKCSAKPAVRAYVGVEVTAS